MQVVKDYVKKCNEECLAQEQVIRPLPAPPLSFEQGTPTSAPLQYASFVCCTTQRAEDREATSSPAKYGCSSFARSKKRTRCCDLFT